MFSRPFVLFFLSWLILGCGRQECAYHPNEKSDYSALDCSPKLSTPFRLGVNPGYYPKNKDYAQGTRWSDIDLATKIQETGFSTFRPALFASILSYYGRDVKKAEYEHSEAIGLRDVVLFLSGGWEVAGDAGGDRDAQNYGCAEASKSFRGLHLPIWVNGKANPENRYAAYVEEVLQGYGDKVKILEVWNEPDLLSNDLLAHRYDYGGNLQADSWWTRDPAPCELLNLYAPIETYVRLLRVTYELTRAYNRVHGRHLLVATGGIGYPSFLNAILEKTDNPDAGKVDAAHPFKGGAYFDLLSYHSYPFFMNYEVDRGKGINVVVSRDGAKAYARHSDHLKDHPVFLLEDLSSVLRSHGFDGKTYPEKKAIVTEIGMHDAAWSLGTVDYSSTVQLQINTVIKSLAAMVRSGVAQVHLYKLGSHQTPGSGIRADVWGELEGGLWSSFGILDDLTARGPSRARLTPLGRAVALWAKELSDVWYDEVATGQLGLPSNMDGIAFSTDWGERKIVVWAKSTVDRSESAEAAYRLPKTWFSRSVTAESFEGVPIEILAGTIHLRSADPVLIH